MKGGMTYTGLAVTVLGIILGMLGVGDCDPTALQAVCPDTNEMARQLVENGSKVVEVVGLVIAARGRQRIKQAFYDK